VALSVWQRRIPHERTFVLGVAGAGVAILVTASMSNLALAMLGISVLGVCAGTVYVLGFTTLGAQTSDDLRGRIFGVFYVLVRLCLLLAFVLAPILSGLLDGLSSHLHLSVHGRVLTHTVGTSAFHVALPGTRLTLWAAGLIILVSALVARRDLHHADVGPADVDHLGGADGRPRRDGLPQTRGESA